MKLTGKAAGRLRGTRSEQRQGPRTLSQVEVRFRRRTVEFAIDNPDDVVQKHLAKGKFYEAPLLRCHADLIYRGSTVLDVGANVGNHSVYYALSGAGRVYPFEPHPRANALLRKTVALNALDAVDLTHLDFGIGADKGELFVRTPSARNLGGSRLADSGKTKVPVARLDDLEVEGAVSFVKIDVEGMEMAVLAGAKALIDGHRPALGIEIDNANLEAFWDWVDAERYHVVHAVKMYRRNINYVCIPRGAAARRPAVQHLA